MNMADFQTLHDIVQLQAQYASVLDHGDIATWPDLFTEEAIYALQSRENYDAKLPLCLLRFESQAMLRDRAYAVTQTIYHDPYYQRHIVSQPLILEQSDSEVRCDTHYLVMRTRRDAMPEVLSVGRYLDRIVRTEQGWRFAERVCVYDNDLIANSIVLPI